MIGDTNDNAPIFKIMNYSVEISESIPVNQVILNVSATDADTGQNSIITYQIVGGNEDQKFSITNHVRLSVRISKYVCFCVGRSKFQLMLNSKKLLYKFSLSRYCQISFKLLDQHIM